MKQEFTDVSQFEEGMKVRVRTENSMHENMIGTATGRRGNSVVLEFTDIAEEDHGRIADTNPEGKRRWALYYVGGDKLEILAP